MKRYVLFIFVVIISLSFETKIPPLKGAGLPDETLVQAGGMTSDSLIFPGEKHFNNMRMLTAEGNDNAEAYFSFDGSKVIFQSTRDGYNCDQIYIMNIDGSNVHMVSTGKGRTTCAYFYADGKNILYASTHPGGDDCPPKPDYSMGYVWPIYDTYDIFAANPDGSNLKNLTSVKGYDAEATVSPIGDRIIFTSTRDGDIDIYSMKLDGSDVTRLTDILGYDGGANYSYNGKLVVWRASRPKTEDEVTQYKEYLAQNLVRPSSLEIYVMNADGSNKRQVTNNGKANFGPYFFPDDKHIIFCSNMDDPEGRNFDLYMINIDGTGLERITYYEQFDGFPMFSLGDGGKKFIFCSNRFGLKPHQSNVFVCDWVE
jgi:Tol biopolymer transport system component